MALKIKECKTDDKIIFEGLYEIIPEIHTDIRGFFFESYSERDFFDAGLKTKFIQDNQSFSKKGVLRGLHFQTKSPQAKLVRSVTGKSYDVAVDLRMGSKTFAKYFSTILDSEKQNMLYIPQGFAHGFLTLSETSVFEYKCSAFYDKESESGIRYDDPFFNINWKDFLKSENFIVSDKDKSLKYFSKEENYFDGKGLWIGK